MTFSLLISDLHLSADHPSSMAAFQRFCSTLAPGADALYILGDLFEYWAGDDDLLDPFCANVIKSLRSLSDAGVMVYLMHGNRDLLMGDALAKAAGATLLDDPTLINLHGVPTLLSHGDTLCTDDVDYQRFRAMVHSPAFQKDFLGRPLAARKAYIDDLRRQSTDAKRSKDSSIMDVNNAAVAAMLREFRYPRLVHGHTHRPSLHEHIVDGHRCERWVLSDWEKNAQALLCDSRGCRVVAV